MFIVRILIFIVFSFLSLSQLSGCSKSPAPLKTSLEAEAKFLKICKEEFNYYVVTKPVGNTIWIYLPIRENILEYKASPKSASPSQPSAKPTLRYLESRFENNAFVVEYDIAPATTYQKSYGYTTAYSREFQKKQINILTTLSRSYFDIQESPGQTMPEIPEFFVLVVADIVRGTEVKGLACFQDFKQAMSVPPAIPQEEYAKRYISEFIGSQAIINDSQGEHLEYKKIIWPEFLAKQIQNRINQKYQQSDFSPSVDTVEEILNIISTTTQIYNFTDFKTVKLHDLQNDKTFLFGREQLKTFVK